MNSIFELAGQTLRHGVLLKAHFDIGRCGSMSIYVFETLKLGKQKNERVLFEVKGGKYWAGGEEPYDYGELDRKREPYNRTGQVTYIPHSFDDLEIIQESEGRRFLSLKKAWPGYASTFSGADNWPEREVAVVLTGEEELGEYLEEILDKMGCPTGDDIRLVKEDILAKLFETRQKVTKERLELHMSIQDAIVAMSEGNPGAVAACVEIMQLGEEIDPDSFAGGLGSLLMLDTLGIYGSRLYMLWNDVCGRDVAKTLAVLRAYQLGQLAGVTEDALNHAIDNRGEGINLEEVAKAVTTRLPNFKLEVATA